MKTLKEYKAELMQNPEFATAYEELKIEMQSIALDHHSPINLKNDLKLQYEIEHFLNPLTS